MYIGLNWHHAEIARPNNNLQFDFAPTPVPDSGRGGYEILFGPYQPYWAMGAGTTQPDAAWQLLDSVAPGTGRTSPATHSIR